MAETYVIIYQGQPSGSAATVYTCAATNGAIIRGIRVVNPTGGTHSITLWQNGTDDAHMILPATAVDAGGVFLDSGVICIALDDTLAAMSSSGSTLTVTIYGVELS